MPTVPVAMCLHDDHLFVESSLKSFAAAGPAIAFVSRLAWDGSTGDWEKCVEAAERAGAEVVLGDWGSEHLHRAAALADMKARGFAHVLIPDGDEVVQRGLLEAILAICQTNLSDLVRVKMDTFWKSPSLVIRPPEELAPILMVDCRTSEHLNIREYSGARPIALGREHGLLLHLSYCGPESRIRRKISTWGHRNEVQPDWLWRVWRGWERDPLMRNLHPTHPQCYQSVERIPVPEELKGAPDFYPPKEEPTPTRVWPKVSVVIPLYGGPEDIAACLDSFATILAVRDALGKPQRLVHEVIVVDDCSPDDAAEVVGKYPFAKLIRNPKNLGFAATCNKGFKASKGEVVVFLNSDTRVPRAGLIRLIESLMDSGSIGAAGPCSNHAGYHQFVASTYTSLDNLDLFAREFATRHIEDEEVAMLVGFCLAVRRSVLDEIGGFDEGFGRGLFEDNDLTYRIQRAGYSTVLSNRSFIHHEGSKSLGRMSEHPYVLLKRNQAIYEEKWKDDIQSGFSSHLPGQVASTITFDRAREPARLRREIAAMAPIADISLCMIVRNEERCLDQCLSSMKGLFQQMVIVDTGSIDKTVQIARRHGAEVYEMPWPDSFSGARNESLRHAQGRWIFWVDADDVLPWSSGEIILRAAIDAPADITGFVVPVQFTDQGPGAGTRVDHVKLFRNLPDLEFEGRIHEQILPSIRRLGGDVMRLEAIVLHAGYDTSDTGQRAKRIRDRKLLKLDYAERPNHPFALFNLGMTAHYCAQHRRAIGWLRRSIHYSKPEESHVRKAYALLGVSQRELGRTEEAIATFQKGKEVVGPDPELQFQAAVTLVALGRYAEAREFYLSMKQDTSSWFSSLDVGMLTFKRLHNLAGVCLALGQYDEAKSYWLESARAMPQFQLSALCLYDAAVAREDFLGARIALDCLRNGQGPSEQWASLRADLASRTGQDAEAELASLQRQFPMASGIGIVLARRLLERGARGQAEPLLKSLEAWGCAEAAFLLGVSAVCDDDLSEALFFMKRALQLNPGHEQTTQQMQALERAMEASA